jgi:two-component system, OmpR family, response regulator
MQSNKHILVALLEDEDVWVQRVSAVVQDLGWLLSAHKTASDLINFICDNRVNLIIVDRMLGTSFEDDGIKVIPRLRGLEITAPILVLSALATSRYRASGLDLGADDYLSKPFDPDELRARMAALLRRSGALSAYAKVRVIGGLEIRTITKSATFEGKIIKLPEQCFAILEALSEEIGTPISKDQLWHRVWPEMRIPPRDTVIEVAISRLRKLLLEQTGKGYVDNLRGKGYQISDV